jgi:hypothetical protein
MLLQLQIIFYVGQGSRMTMQCDLERFLLWFIMLHNICLCYMKSNDRLLMNSELGRMRKEEVVICF